LSTTFQRLLALAESLPVKRTWSFAEETLPEANKPG